MKEMSAGRGPFTASVNFCSGRALLSELNEGSYHVQGYANDTDLAGQGRFSEAIADIMNEGLQQLVNWCRRQNLRVNASKMVILPFTHKRNGLGQK